MTNKYDKNESLPSREKRLLEKMQINYLNHLVAEAKYLARKKGKRKHHYYNAEKSYERFQQKMLGEVIEPKSSKKLNMNSVYKVASFIGVAALFTGILVNSVQAIEEGTCVEIDNGINSLANFYWVSDDIVSDFDIVNKRMEYDSLEDIEELTGMELLVLDEKITKVVYTEVRSTVTDAHQLQNLNILYESSTYDVICLITIHSDILLREEMFWEVNDCFLAEQHNIQVIQISNYASKAVVVYNGISYEFAAPCGADELELMLQTLEIKIV